MWYCSSWASVIFILTINLKFLYAQHFKYFIFKCCIEIRLTIYFDVVYQYSSIYDTLTIEKLFCKVIFF